MANNKVCLVNKVTGEGIVIAKFDPEFGWYAWNDLESRLDALFARKRLLNNSMYGGNDWALEYDIEDPTPGDYMQTHDADGTLLPMPPAATSAPKESSPS